MSLMMDLLPLELLCEILALAGWEEKEDELAIRSTCRTFWAITDGTFLALHSADCLVRQPMNRLIFHEVYMDQDDDLDTFIARGEWGIHYRMEPCFPTIDLDVKRQMRMEYISCPSNLPFDAWPHMRKIIFRRYYLLDKPWPDNMAYF